MTVHDALYEKKAAYRSASTIQCPGGFEVDDKLIAAFKTVTEQQRQIGTWTRREIVPDGSVGASLRQTVHLSALPLPLSSCCVAVKRGSPDEGFRFVSSLKPASAGFLLCGLRKGPVYSSLQPEVEYLQVIRIE
ncbi:hypothetical protein [Kalamiella sp. sgz302252]|uniref:hypothetical protein n=1 Tax=Pantoea sp. sgz302252 TaxID=3341827 RepID=UPI0036D2157D